MMLKTRYLLTCLFLIASCYFVIKDNSLSVVHQKYSWQKVYEENLACKGPDKIIPIFNSKGIEDIVLISMVKNEEDIIFENLVWHYAIGFRKFIIIDNNSTDNTKSIIEKFAALTEKKAIVFLINDKIFEHIQTRIITGSYLFAKSVWP